MWTAGIDLYDRLSSAEDNAEIWRIVNAEMTALGASAVNLAEIALDGRGLLRMQSSMKPEFRAEYVAQGYQQVDDFVTDIGAACYRGETLTGTLERSTASSLKALEFNWALRDAGFTLGLAHRFAGNSAQTRKVVVFCTGEAASAFDPELRRRISATATAAAAFLSPCGTCEGFVDLTDQRPPGRLTGRERQVLALLAAGHQNARIAHQLEIAEVTVRKTLLSARRKLSARTREEALAKAVRAGLLDF